MAVANCLPWALQTGAVCGGYSHRSNIADIVHSATHLEPQAAAAAAAAATQPPSQPARMPQTRHAGLLLPRIAAVTLVTLYSTPIDAVTGSLSAELELRSGALTLTVGQNGSYSIGIQGQLPVRGAALSVFAEGAAHTMDNGGLLCPTSPRATNGSDEFGDYNGCEVVCKVGQGGTRALFSWRAYPGRVPGHGKLVFALTLPDGANNTNAQKPFDVHNTSPQHFAPFPAWHIEGAFNKSGFLCYGGDKSHLYSSYAPDAGGTGMSGAPQTCFHLGNGPATHVWPSSGTTTHRMHALVTGPADSFHLNYNRLQSTSPAQDGILTAKLWQNMARGDVVLCLSQACDRTQHNSGYTVLSANEGTINPASIPPPGMPGGKGLSVPLYFSWSQANTDNWVTNSSVCPGKSYNNCGNADGLIYCCPAKGRIPLDTYSNRNNTHHIAVASNKSKEWATVHGYIRTGTLGYLDAPSTTPSIDLCTTHSGTDYVCCDLKRVNVSSPAECCTACKETGPSCTGWKTNRDGGECYLKTGTLYNPVKVGSDVVVGYSSTPKSKPNRDDRSLWTFGVSGDVVHVPPGFKQSTLFVHSQSGANDAWDEWGATLRAAYNTTKAADEDIFLTALTMWTDNGAATLGPAWKAKQGTIPPAVAPGPVGPNAHNLGQYKLHELELEHGVYPSIG